MERDNMERIERDKPKTINRSGVYIYNGTESEIQLPLKRFPDSSVSSLIPVGWCEEGKGFPPPETRSNIPMDRQLPDGD